MNRHVTQPKWNHRPFLEQFFFHWIASLAAPAALLPHELPALLQQWLRLGRLPLVVVLIVAAGRVLPAVAAEGPQLQDVEHELSGLTNLHWPLIHLYHVNTGCIVYSQFNWGVKGVCTLRGRFRYIFIIVWRSWVFCKVTIFPAKVLFSFHTITNHPIGSKQITSQWDDMLLYRSKPKYCKIWCLLYETANNHR